MAENITNISPFFILKLERIFKDHNWSLEMKEEKALFIKFCLMLNHLSEEQQECILEITKNFLRIDFNDYYNHIKKCLDKIDPNFIDPIDRIFIAPMRLGSPNENGGTSSICMSYLFQNPIVIDNTILRNKKIIIIQKFASLPKNFNNKSNLLFLVDDFIGSGETAFNCLQYLNNNGINLQKVIVLSLVIQNIGYKKISNFDSQIVFSVYRERGISDSYKSPSKEKLTRIMVSIEDLLRIIPKNRFGYNQTEALVKMIRTPNNTFPVYWENVQLTNGKLFISPFPRN